LDSCQCVSPIEFKTQNQPDQNAIAPDAAVDQIDHLLQRTVEGGHWMISPPLLLKLVHAVQQPIGNPAFTAIAVQHPPIPAPYSDRMPDPNALQTIPEAAPTAETELNSITAWRFLGATDAYLLGGLQIHAASTAKVNILAEWDDPVDDLSQPSPGSIRYAAPVDEIPIHQLTEHRINVATRSLAYYDADHDLLCFAQSGDALGNLPSGAWINQNTAPRHLIDDTRHHRIRYTAVATSRYQEYFSQELPDPNNSEAMIRRDFTRQSQPVTVEVPASTRPIAPQIAYVIPTFGWQRQTETNLKRSVRFGGGLRVYLERPWFSSGEGELLCVTLYAGVNADIAQPEERDRWKSYITQWGNDPIWRTADLPLQTPRSDFFPDAIAQELSLKLEEDASKRVDVVGYPVAFDAEQQKWYCDLTLNASQTYSPFVRLALVRYQPYALVDAKISRVVLADFVQLTPERSVMLTADPYQPRQLRISISGIQPTQADRAPVIKLKLQERDESIQTDLTWRDAAPEAASFLPDNTLLPSVLYKGTIQLNGDLQPDRYRLVISEYESFPADGLAILVSTGSRLIYCETLMLDQTLLGAAGESDRRTSL
jgi:hypothetical protein